MAVRNLSKRVDELETANAPFVPRKIHLVVCSDGMEKDTALAAYEAERGPVGADGEIIYLVGLEPRAAA